MARHYGIPYMGSKQKLVDKIVPYIVSRHPDMTDFYDLFGGGGSVALYAVRKYPKASIHYSELSKAISALMLHLKEDGEINFDWVGRPEFKKLRGGDDYKAGLMQTVRSFGNKTASTYLYGKDIQDYKEELSKLAMTGKGDTSFIEKFATEYIQKNYGADINIKIYLNTKKYTTPYQRRIVLNRQIPHMGHLQHLGRLERLVQIKKLPGIKDLIINSAKSYDEVQINKAGKPVIYCDPPYEGTTEYEEGGFNHKEFYDWVMLQPHPVYVSSYKISDKRLKLLRSVKTRSLLDQKTRSNYHYNYENIYWNGVN